MRCYSPNCITCDLGRVYIFFSEEEHQMWKIKLSQSTKQKNLPTYAYVPWEVCRAGLCPGWLVLTVLSGALG